MDHEVTDRPAHYPVLVHRIEDLGVPVSLLHDLVLRRALLDGRTSTMKLAENMMNSAVNTALKGTKI